MAVQNYVALVSVAPLAYIPRPDPALTIPDTREIKDELLGYSHVEMLNYTSLMCAITYSGRSFANLPQG